MRIRKEDCDFWLNKGCQTARIATAIKAGRKNVLYMYIGGDAVDHERSVLLGGVVVICQNWRWAALSYAAARVAGLACNNTLGPMNPALVIPEDDKASDAMTLDTPQHLAFPDLCENMWLRVRASCDDLLYDLETQRRSDNSARSTQSVNAGIQLEYLLSKHNVAVIDLLGGSV